MQASVTEQITVYASRCLNARGSTAFCRLCIDGCPRSAIDITDVGIHFNSSRCTECALCVRDCPTEVFSHDGFTPVDFIFVAKEKKELHLYCQIIDSNHVKPGCLPIPCHGLLNDRLLVGLRTMGVGTLHLHGLDRCNSCLSRTGAQRLAQTLERRPAALKDHLPSLHGVSQTGDVFSLDSGETTIALKGSETPMDRRKFLEGAVNTVAYAALSSLPTELLQEQSTENDLVASEQNECMVKHVPQFHQLARLNLQTGDISADDTCTGDVDAWFHQVRDHGSCDACAICSLSCPTGALLIEDSEQTLRLNHQPAICIGCGLCSSLCPQQSLELRAVHDDATILDDCTYTLFECEKLKCSSCGGSFTCLDDDTRLCKSCENENTIRSHWPGEAG